MYASLLIMAKIITKNEGSSFKLFWKAGTLPHLEEWLDVRQEMGVAAKDLNFLLESPEAREERIQALIDKIDAELQEFLDTVGGSVLSSQHEKQHGEEDERCPANLDTVGVAPGLESQRKIWPRGKIRLEFLSQQE